MSAQAGPLGKDKLVEAFLEEHPGPSKAATGRALGELAVAPKGRGKWALKAEAAAQYDLPAPAAARPVGPSPAKVAKVVSPAKPRATIMAAFQRSSTSPFKAAAPAKAAAPVASPSAAAAASPAPGSAPLVVDLAADEDDMAGLSDVEDGAAMAN